MPAKLPAPRAAVLALLLLPLSYAAQNHLHRLYLFDNLAVGRVGGVAAGRDGALYGLSGGGGTCPRDTDGCGTVFRLQRSAGKWTAAIIYNFTSENGDGAFPFATPLVAPDGTIYGTTGAGGAYGSGTIFRLKPPAAPGAPWTETTLYSFNGSSSGAALSLLLGDGGRLYAASSQGGNYGQGLVFELSPPATAGDAWTETDLYSFTGASDGGQPASLVLGPHGVIYGAAAVGGPSNGGMVFQLTPPSSPRQNWTEFVLYNFGGAAGSGPANLTLDSAGTLYGTTQSTVFALSPPGSPGAPWTQTTLHTFNFAQDGIPDAPLLLSGDSIYGAAGPWPYIGIGPQGGVVFQITRPAQTGGGWKYRNYYFRLNTPYGGLVLKPNGAILGTTLDGPGVGNGFLYEVQP